MVARQAVGQRDRGRGEAPAGRGRLARGGPVFGEPQARGEHLVPVAGQGGGRHQLIVGQVAAFPQERQLVLALGHIPGGREIACAQRTERRDVQRVLELKPSGGIIPP